MSAKQRPFQMLTLGFQHVLAMYAGAVIVPLIVGGALKLSTEQITYLIAIDLLTCGVATLLQVWQNRFFGIGLPVVLGCAFQAVGPMIAIGTGSGMSAIYGAIIASGLFVLVFAGVFGRLVRFFPPVVTGSIVTTIGITLIPVAVNNMAGGVGSSDFGNVENLALSFGVLAFILIINRFFKGFIRAISVLLGMIIGTGIAFFMGKVNFSAVVSASWVRLPKIFYFDTPTFEFIPIITMILVAIVSMIESTGVFMALGKICERELDEKDLARGYRAEGLAIILGGIFNAFPYTTFSQNVGLVQLSNVKTRYAIFAAGGILILLGLAPKVAAITTVIPNPVLGGAMMAMFGMVVASGVRMLGQVDLNRNENLLIVACSVGMGLGVTVVPDLFKHLPQSVRILSDSGIVLASLTAVGLNMLFHLGKKKEAAKVSIQGEQQTVAS